MTSRHERRLWLLAVGAVVGTWVTLPLGPRVAAAVVERGLADAAFGVGVLAVLATIVLHGARRRPRAAEVAAYVGIAAVYGLAAVRLAAGVERTHLVEYGVIAVLVHAALLERARGGAPVARPALLAFVAAAGAGIVDELLQWVVPNRVFDLRDIGFNVVAAALAIGAAVVLERVRPDEADRQ